MGSPLLLGLILVGALVGAVYAILGVVGRRAKTYGRAVPSWRSRLPAGLLVGAVACVVLALLQFRIEREATQGTVMLTLDVSASMDRTDVAPDRLSAAKGAVEQFVDTIPEGFPVGLVTFAGEPKVVVPPTDDRALITAALDALPRGRGTVIGDGMSLTLDAIEADRVANGDRPAAAIVLSDGRDTGSEVTPEAAAERAASLGIPVFTVVLGQDTGGAEGGANAGLLQQIAETTGASSFSAATGAELQAVYEGLGEQLSTDLAIGGTGPLFIVLGALFAVAAGLMVLLAGRSEY
ncbi:MAG: VWA domain-containing protein [Actinomycetota bacterium]